MSYVATIGFFDGVHRGHRYLLDELVRTAQSRSLLSLVVTFSRHPREFLKAEPPRLLTTLDERVSLIRACGVDKVVPIDFPDVRSMTAGEFLRLLHNEYDVSVLLMGYDHSFGSDGIRDFEQYKLLGSKAGIEVLPISCAPEGEVSSSKIRSALLAGDVEKATFMLGRPFALRGVVVKGRGLGHSLGFPTANLKVAAEMLLPANGVYAVKAEIDSREYKGVMNIGTNPTVGGDRVSVEVHLLDYAGNAYGKTMSVECCTFLRGERRFNSLTELQNQIQNDITTAKSILK